jgi:hypothetical protein
VAGFGPSDIEVGLLEEVFGLFDSGIVLLQLGSRLTTKLGLERVDLLDKRVDLSEAKAGPCELDFGLLEEVFGLELDGSLIPKLGLERVDLLDKGDDLSVAGFGPFDVEVELLLDDVFGLFNAGIVLFELGGSLTTKFGLERVDLLDERVVLSEATSGPCEVEGVLLEEHDSI